MVGAWAGAAAVFALALLATRVAGATTLEPHTEVRGADVAEADFRPTGASTWRALLWDELDGLELEPGTYQVRAAFGMQGPALAQPCKYPRALDAKLWQSTGTRCRPRPAPSSSRSPRGGTSSFSPAASVRTNDALRAEKGHASGTTVQTIEGLGVLRFDSPHEAGPGAVGLSGARSIPASGGSAVVYVPPAHDVRRAAPLLVGTHPWNGSIWTYAAYADLLREACARDIVLLFPSGLGNSLYTAEAEDEVMRAVGALARVVAIDPRAVSIWGASMGGAGATTIGLHHPDQFASITSFFGDAKYDTTSYVRSILPDERAAHRVNALDVADNARHVPVWLIHGENDRTSPIRQSEILARALAVRGFSVRFDHIAHVGHSGALVARWLPSVVAMAAAARVPAAVGRVTYRSVRSEDAGAYGVRLERVDHEHANGPTSDDAFVDIERRDDGVHVLRAEGVRAVELERGALGTDPDHPPQIVVEGSVTFRSRPGAAREAAAPVAARWAGAAP